MDASLSADREIPPVPKKTYQWEDLRRSRESGGYPWTHLLKPPLEGDITADDILRETTPRRSMSREFSRSRTRSPVDENTQRIIQLDSSPGSSRKHGEEGEDKGIQIPHFSQEVSLDSEEDAVSNAFNSYKASQSPEQSSSKLSVIMDMPRSVSPKGILKKREAENYFIGVTEAREKSKCCHPLVNKIKHLADKTLQRLEKTDSDKSPNTKRKSNDDQEIRQLTSSPGAIRRQKFGAIKLGDSDEMSKTLNNSSNTQQKNNKEHIYEDIDQSKPTPKVLQVSEFSEEYILCNKNGPVENKEIDSHSEKKSINSADPSLITEDNNELKPEDHIMEKLHKIDNIKKEALVLEDELDDDEPNVDEVFQNQLDEDNKPNSVIITELTDEESEILVQEIKPVVDSSPSPQEENPGIWSKTSRRWTSEGGKPSLKLLRPTREGSVQSFTPEVRCACQFFQSDSLLPERNLMGTRPTSRASYTSYVIGNKSDHEYEIIEKPPPNIVYTAASVDEYKYGTKAEDDLSSTTSFERNLMRNVSDEEFDEEVENDENDMASGTFNGAEILQRNIEDRYFVNTPSTVSRTECDISTSQVDSSALENLPLKRENRNKPVDSMDNRIQQKLKEGRGKLKSQAGKLKQKLQSIKNKQFTMPERPKFSLPERPKFSLPERPKLSLPERPKFKMPEKPKISLPDKSKFSLSEKRKFSLPERPKLKKINISEKLSGSDKKKFTLPDRPKFNMPDLSKMKFTEKPKTFLSNLGKRMQSNPAAAVTNIQSQSVEYEVKTYPRLLQRKKKTVTLTSSSPSLNKEETPPPVFKFARKKIEKPIVFDTNTEIHNNDMIEEQIMEKSSRDISQAKYNMAKDDIDEVPPFEQECKHVINEIDNDEFFIRPRGISRENIQVREYLSDEIRQAFKIPKNSLATMGDYSHNDHHLSYDNDEGDPELLDDTEGLSYSNENINDRDDGYYTFPPARPSRVKQKKKELDSVQFIDENCSGIIEYDELNEIRSAQVSGQHQKNIETKSKDCRNLFQQVETENPQMVEYSINDYENSEMEFPDLMALQSQTLPMPPRRKRKGNKNEIQRSSLGDIHQMGRIFHQVDDTEEMFVYRTEHEYIVPETEPEEVVGQSPIAPRRLRNKSRCSQGTSLYDDDRTSHGAESLTLDTHVLPIDDFEKGNRETRQESPGYATVDKSNYRKKPPRRSISKTPPLKRRKSDTTDRKYYTVGANKQSIPDRPPRKKSSQSLVTLNNSIKRSTGDVTQYAEIEDVYNQEIHRELISGEVINKMKDRPLPPPPRPPRELKEKKKSDFLQRTSTPKEENTQLNCINQTIVEAEVSTQTDPLPDDVDFELGIDENLDFSVSSSVREFDEDQMTNKSLSRRGESMSRPTSRSEKSFKASDPKISELSKSSWGRTSPTVILVERRVSSPTRINQREEMLTEASLTVQHIDIDESKVSELPLLPMPRRDQTQRTDTKDIVKVVPSDNTPNYKPAGAKNIQLQTLLTENLCVKDLEVGRLNVSELQANKIKVSDIEGLTLQISAPDSNSNHISLSGIDFSQNMIDEIVKKFAEISAREPSTADSQNQTTETLIPENQKEKIPLKETSSLNQENLQDEDESASIPLNCENIANPPQRPPPPDLTPLLYSYLHDISLPPSSLYHIRSPRERPFTEFHEAQHHSPPPPPPPPPPVTRRARRKPAIAHSASSSDSDINKRPSSRRAPPNAYPQEPTVSEAGAQFLRVCHNSISRSIRNIFHIFMSYISGTEDKRDVQMALVIFLVLIAGLILFGISDSRTIHHHHWEFFNPPDSKPL